MTRPLRILTVYAHPDDESFGPSAILAKYAQAGAVLVGMWFTCGEAGASTLVPAPTPDELGRLRELDLRDAAQAIGYQTVRVLDFADGGLSLLPEHVLTTIIAAEIRRWRPDVLLTFGPAGITRHPDHLAVHRATLAAFEAARIDGLDVREVYFDAVPAHAAEAMGISSELDGQPNTWIDIADTQHVRLQALSIHARHIADAVEILDRLQQTPPVLSPLYRYFPPTPVGEIVTGFLSTSTPKVTT